MSSQRADLFLRLARGERHAFAEIHARYGARVAAIARGRLGPRLRARLETDDLTQEAWATLARGVPPGAFASEGEFLAWIAGVVERRALREARHWSRQRRRSEREAAGVDPASHADRRAQRPSEIVVRREATARLGTALAKLPGKEREVVVLRHTLGLPWRDVATALGVTVECAQVRCQRARQRLAGLLPRRAPG